MAQVHGGDRVMVDTNGPQSFMNGEIFTVRSVESNHLGTFVTGDRNHNGVYVKNLVILVRATSAVNR